VELDAKTCYRALRTRDARFDGRFFTAVRSTGIYCRPICPASAPKLANCEFVPSAAAAQEQGYRPCMRCRPEASPGTPTWLGTSAAVSRAVRLIASGALDEADVGQLAARLGMGDRHLRRLFLKHLGASPIAVAQTQRIHFAKKLIDETALPMSEVALASGFRSIRRFNDAILKTFDRAPRDMRRVAAVRKDASGLTLKLAYRPPFRWASLAGYLAGRATAGVESVDRQAYRRTVRVGGSPGWIEVRPAKGANHLVATLHLSGAGGLVETADRIRRLFDLGAEPREIAACLRGDPRIGPLVKRFPGVRVPGAWDGFELAVRAILGQQITVKAATTLAGRLAEGYGEKLPPDDRRPQQLRYLFPEPRRLARARLERIGLPRARARTIATLAAAVVDGKLKLEPSSPYDETVEKLVSLPGIGAWTAQYVAMRALGYPDAFPSGDLGLQRAVTTEAGTRSTATELETIAEAWRPWRAYAAICLWLANPPAAGRRKK